MPTGDRTIVGGNVGRETLKLLIDTNVILDLLLEREDWLEDSGFILSACDAGIVDGYVASHTITTVHYLLAKSKGRETASLHVAALLGMLEVVCVDGTDLHEALHYPMKDFEDAVQVAAARSLDADYLATRNRRDYPEDLVKARTPTELWPLIQGAFEQEEEK